ncbi:hypothetical protein PRIC2_005077 [Phytophthora ramorum]
MSWNEAAGAPLAGQTSWHVIHTYDKLQEGQRVLILGGSRGTGALAIQIARAAGAEVIATCSSRNTELVKSLGADRVLDYTEDKWSDVLAEHSIDLIYDCGYDAASWNDVAQNVLKEKTGIFVTILTVDKLIESPQYLAEHPADFCGLDGDSKPVDLNSTVLGIIVGIGFLRRRCCADHCA